LQDDALQIIEQILPFFQPAYNVTVNMLDGVEESRDIPFTLRNISFTDEYEGDFSNRRFIQYDLDFVAKTYFYQEVPTDEGGIIKKVQVDYSTNIRAPREQRYTVVPVAKKDYNADSTSRLAAALDTKKTLVTVTTATGLIARSFIQIDEEVMRIRELNGTSLIVSRGQYGTKIQEHDAQAVINNVDSLDTDMLEVGDDFGFSENSSFFGNDGLTYSPNQGRDVEAP